MIYPFFYDSGTKRTFLNAIKILLEDIKTLEEDRQLYTTKYHENPNFDNINLFYSRAKVIEQMLLLGITAEYLIKAILIKHNFIINNIKIGAKFSDDFCTKLKRNNDLGTSVTHTSRGS